MSNTLPKELRISVNGLDFAAQAWGNPKDFPVLALHGWLDNAASFFALAPLLNNIYLVAIDMAGHGQSNHRLGVAPYNIWEDVADIFAVANQLGWQTFSLLGHSRGAIISALAAGTLPERVHSLCLIEGLIPEAVSGENAPKQLALSIQSIQKKVFKRLTVYPDIKVAITARQHGMYPLSYHAASALTARGVRQVEGGFHWSTDPLLLVPSAVKFTPEQIAAFIHNITSPIQLILAKDGMLKIYPHYQDILSQFPQVQVEIIEGGHHLHMEQEVEKVASIVNSFFVQHLSSTKQ